MSGVNGAPLKGTPPETATAAGGLAPAQPHPLELPAPRGVFLRDRLHGLRVQMQPLLRSATRELREIESRKKPAFAIEHRDLQVVAVVPNEVDLACETAEELRVLILEPQPQNFDVCGRGAGHRFLYVIISSPCADCALSFSC